MKAFYSYAPSFEDVLLGRAFKGLEKGFYVEVGARHPAEGSLTYALYQTGWRGITIEPTSDFADYFVQLRPADTHLLVRAGEKSRPNVTYHHWKSIGPKPATPSTTRDIVTLDEILQIYAPRDIQFLAIRPSAASAILAGLDLSRFRPWVIIIGTSEAKEIEGVEARLAGARYVRTHFDGLNRFFLAEEHHGRLAHHFLQPINALDHIVTVRGGDHEALNLAIAERNDLAIKLAKTDHLRRLAQESAAMSLGLRPNWPRKIELPSQPTPPSPAPAPDSPPRVVGDELAITVTGHMNGSYSLAIVNRNYAEALARFSKAQVHVLPIEGGKPAAIERIEGPDMRLFERLSGEPVVRANLNVVISQHYPPFVPEGDYDLKLMIFFWEESIVPLHLVEVINKDFDAVLVATKFVAKTLIDSGVTLPVRVVRHPGRFQGFEALREERMVRGAKGPEEETVFLHVSSCFPRKGVDRLVEAYLEAFSADDPVRLIIKGFPNPHNDVANEIATLRMRLPNRAPITFINQDMSEDRLLGLYRRADALVLPTRGEGLNLPAAEALISGLPLIVTAFGGHLDFCPPDTVSLVNFSFSPSRSHLATPGSVWAEPDGQDLKKALIEMREQINSRPFMPVLDEAKAFFDRRTFAARIEEVIEEIAHPWWDENGPSNVAWVSTYEVRCGIAEYSRHLVKALRACGLKISVLADTRTPPDLPTPPELEALHPIWDPGNQESIEATAERLAMIEPDVVVIQYHPAYLGWGAIGTLIEDALRKKAVVLVTLHNVRWLTHQSAIERNNARSVLERVDRIVVHTVLDLNFMKQLGFIDNVVLIPQGVAILDNLPADRGISLSTAPIIGCYGFFLPHKGIYALIEAFSEVRHSYPNAKLRLVNAEYPVPDSAAEIVRCRDLVARLGLQEAVEWETAFLPHEASIGLLADCDIVVLPYEDTNEASSAAVRGALSSRRPVAVTPIQIFEELGDTAYQLPGTGTHAIAQGLMEFLGDDALRLKTLNAAFKWLDQHDWGAIAGRLHAMIQGLWKVEHRKR